MKREEILSYLRSQKETFRRKYAVERIGLFGSYARGEATEGSDIDLFVEMKPDLFAMTGLKQEIATPLDIIRKHRHMKPLLYKKRQKDIVYV